MALEAARQLGYQPNDPSAVGRALDKIAGLPVKVLANMHGPTVIGHFDKLVRTFRDNSLTAWFRMASAWSTSSSRLASARHHPRPRTSR